LAEEGAEAVARIEILVVCLEHVPRRGEVIPEVSEEFAVGDGDEELTWSDAVDFAEDGGGVVEVFEYFEAERGVEGSVCEGEGAAVDVAMRETEEGEFGAIGGVDLGAHPSVTVGQEGAPVGAETAADIEHAARRRAEMTAEQHSDFTAALGEGGTLGENVGAALDRGGALIEENAEMVGAVIARDGENGDGGEGRSERAIAKAGVEADGERKRRREGERGRRREGERGRRGEGERGRGGEGGEGVVAEELEAGEGGRWERKGGGDVGAGVERGRETEEDVGAVGCGRVGFEGRDGGLGVESVEPEPAADLERQGIDGRSGTGSVQMGGHESGEAEPETDGVLDGGEGGGFDGAELADEFNAGDARNSPGVEGSGVEPASIMRHFEASATDGRGARDK
jgi:hypothetical protein